MKNILKNKKTFSFLIVLLTISLFFSFSTPLFAQGTTFDNPIVTDNITVLIGNVIKIILGILGSVALLVFIIGGFMWLTSMGNPEKVKKGRDTLVWAALGIIIIFSSYALVKLVFDVLMVR